MRTSKNRIDPFAPTVAARIIDEALARLGRNAVWDDYLAIGRELFPDEMRLLGESFSRNGFIKWMRDHMRRAVNIDESNPYAPTVQMDLPGLAAPAYLNVGSNNTPQLVRFADVTVDDISVAIAHRARVIGAVSARNEDLMQKREWLKKNRTHDAETFGEVCARLGVRISDPLHAQRPEGDHHV